MIHCVYSLGDLKTHIPVSRACTFFKCPLWPMEPRKLSFWALEDEIPTMWYRLRMRSSEVTKSTVPYLLKHSGCNKKVQLFTFPGGLQSNFFLISLNSFTKCSFPASESVWYKESTASASGMKLLT